MPTNVKPTEELNDSRAVVKRVWEDVVNGGDLDAIDELVAEDYMDRGPGGYECTGPDGFRRFIVALHEIFEGLTVTVHEYILEDDRVLSRWTGRATSRENGRDVEWHGATVTHITDGKMIEDWEYWDRLELAEQMTDGWLDRWIVDTVSRRATKDLPDE
ncbi:MAG: ester cyclase [Halodesulfurarchaeum sp.]